MYSSFKAGRYHSHWERQEHQPGEAGWLGGWTAEPSWASLWNHHSNEMLLVVQVTRMAVLCSDERANQHQYRSRSSEAGQSKHGWAALVCGENKRVSLDEKRKRLSLYNLVRHWDNTGCFHQSESDHLHHFCVPTALLSMGFVEEWSYLQVLLYNKEISQTVLQ